MPATRPRASFDPISPEFDLSALVEETSNFAYVDRISCDMIDQQGLEAFDKLVLLHVIIGGKPLVIDGYHSRLDPWTFSSKWLQDNVGDKVENARNLTKNEPLPLTIGHYLKNMSKLTEQYFEKSANYRDKNRQRVYLKDIDCPDVWLDKLREHLPPNLFYLNENTGDIGGPGSRDETMPTGGKRKGHGIGPAGDLMSSLPAPMRAENLMCYIGHEGTYTPAHREMCGSLGHNIMVEASEGLGLDGKPERSGSSIWFMTESKDRETVAEYWLSILGHDIEVENHFAQVMAWKKAPFTTYVVEQRPGDFILIPPLAPHQVWNRGTRTMKVAWNRTTAETLEFAMKEALPNAKMVCRDEQYKNKAIIYYTLQKYSNLLARAKDQEQTASSPQEAAAIRTSPKIRQLQKDFRKLFQLFKNIMLSEMFAPDSHEKNIQLNPFDSNITCAYCRGNIFNRFLTCTSCDDVLGTNEPEPYDVCMECYSMGRSCGCISKLRWAEQFKWKELVGKYELWRQRYLELERKPKPDSPLPLAEERQRLEKKTLAQICQEQLKRRPWVDINKAQAVDEDEDEEEEIEVNDDGTVKKTKKRKSESWLKNRHACHVCQKRHEKWKMAACKCGRWWCYGSLFRAHDLMPQDVMADPDWTCPHCQNICGAGSCRKDARQTPYQPKGTLLGHDTRKVADVRSVESLVDFSVSNLSWLKESAASPAENQRLAERQQEADRAKAADLTMEDCGSDDENRIEYSPGLAEDTVIDPLLDDSTMDTPIRTTRPHLDNGIQSEHDGYQPAIHNGYIAPSALLYQPPVDDEDLGDLLNGGTGSSNKRKRTGDDDDGIIRAQPRKRIRPEDRDLTLPISDATKQYRKQEERKALEEARKKGRFIQVHAALKGKTKLVKLAVSQEILARLQSSAPRIRAPVAAAPAAPQVEDDLLRSDLAPAPTAKATVPTKVDTQTKHVRVRVEEDDDFDARHRKRRPRKSAGKAAGRKPGTYEELDIESEPENMVDEGETTGTTLRTRRQARRQEGDDADDDELEELPNDWKDGTSGRNRKRAPPRGAAARSSIGGKGVSRLQPQRENQREEANRLAKLAAAANLAGDDDEDDDEEDELESDESGNEKEISTMFPAPTFKAINAAAQGGAKAVAVSSEPFVKSVAMGSGSILNRTGPGGRPIRIVGASNRRKTTDGMGMAGKAVGKVNMAKSSPLTK